MTALKALSIKQPWCHRILFEGKDVENRSWPTKFRGPVLIHASKSPIGMAECRELGAPLGGIVGLAYITDCVTRMDSQWFFGKYGFVLRNARPCQFIPMKGQLSFFQTDISIDNLEFISGADQYDYKYPERIVRKPAQKAPPKPQLENPQQTLI